MNNKYFSHLLIDSNLLMLKVRVETSHPILKVELTQVQEQSNYLKSN